MRAINLRTEHMINPIGIDSKEPYLSWNCEDGRRQTAYQIVAMDENGSNYGIVCGELSGG